MMIKWKFFMNANALGTCLLPSSSLLSLPPLGTHSNLMLAEVPPRQLWSYLQKPKCLLNLIILGFGTGALLG